jgi:hypothetical protein
MPYALLMRVPPFDLGRTPVRFVVVGLFFLMLCAAGVRGISVAIAASLVILAPVALNLIGDEAIRPPFGQTSHYSANLAGFFVPNPYTTPLYGNVFEDANAKVTLGLGGYEAFLGFLPLVFGVVGVLRTRRRLVYLGAALGLVFFVLSLGPTLKVLGTETGLSMPYALLMRVPPFDLGRTPVRFVVVGLFFLMLCAALFFLMLCAAFGLDHVMRETTRRWGVRRGVATMSLLLFWTAAEGYSPFDKQQPFVPPPGLESLVEGPVLNVPPYSSDGYAAMLQVFHHQPIGTGYLSRATPEYLEEIRRLREAWNRGGPDFCDLVTSLGFRNIVINPTHFVPPSQRSYGALPDLLTCPLNVVDLRRDGRRVRARAGDAE